MRIITLCILTAILTNNLIFAQTDCEKAKVQATLDFQKSIYSFHSEEMLPVEQTYFYVLRQYYKVNWYFTDSLDYYNCYDAKMTELLKTIYGKDFLNRARILTDSLDKTENWKSDPEYPEGQQAFTKLLLEKLKQAGIKTTDFTTKIYINFIISKSGKIINAEIIRGVNADIDRKIVTIIKQMPKWKPAYLYGKPIKQRYTMPVKLE
jgi:hypothetical protein